MITFLLLSSSLLSLTVSIITRMRRWFWRLWLRFPFVSFLFIWSWTFIVWCRLQQPQLSYVNNSVNYTRHGRIIHIIPSKCTTNWTQQNYSEVTAHKIFSWISCHGCLRLTGTILISPKCWPHCPSPWFYPHGQAKLQCYCCQLRAADSTSSSQVNPTFCKSFLMCFSSSCLANLVVSCTPELQALILTVLACVHASKFFFYAFVLHALLSNSNRDLFSGMLVHCLRYLQGQHEVLDLDNQSEVLGLGTEVLGLSTEGLGLAFGLNVKV